MVVKLRRACPLHLESLLMCSLFKSLTIIILVIISTTMIMISWITFQLHAPSRVPFPVFTVE